MESVWTALVAADVPCLRRGWTEVELETFKTVLHRLRTYWRFAAKRHRLYLRPEKASVIPKQDFGSLDVTIGGWCVTR